MLDVPRRSNLVANFVMTFFTRNTQSTQNNDRSSGALSSEPPTFVLTHKNGVFVFYIETDEVAHIHIRGTTREPYRGSV